MSKITKSIVEGNPNYEKTIFTDKFQDKCTDEELEELYDTLYGWTTLSLYNTTYKKRLREVMKNIDKKLKTRKKKNTLKKQRLNKG